MNSRSRTRSRPASFAAASRAKIALHNPISAALSPPTLIWWYCELIGVDLPESISTGLCGLVKRSKPRSRSGLKTIIGTPRWAHSCRSCSMRGLFTPVLWPKNKIQSVDAKSSSVIVPTGTPMLSGNPTDVLSWHMFELSGKLLLPKRRANNAYI